MCQVLPRCFALLLITLSGCATWHASADKPSKNRGLPAPRRNPGGAVLEVAFVSILPASPPRAEGEDKSRPAAALDSRPLPVGADESAAASASDRIASDDPVPTTLAITPSAPETVTAQYEHDDIWHWIDETVVAPEVRHALRRNGLRVGKAMRVADFTQRLNQIRRQPDQSARVLEIAEVQSDLSHQSRKITCRIGKRYELPVRQPAVGDQPVLVKLGGQTLGKTLSQAQPLFALRATTADVNSITLSLLPEIQHGAMQPTWVGSDAGMSLANRRESWSFDELFTEIRLEKGGILVAGCISPTFGLGQQMFTGTTADGDTDQVLMVIRVADLPELIDP